MFTVKEAARKAKVTPHAVRYYDNLGLLGELARDESGARALSDEDVEWLELIALLSASGLSLAEVARFAELRREGPVTEPERKRIIEQRADILRERANALDRYAAYLA